MKKIILITLGWVCFAYFAHAQSMDLVLSSSESGTVSHQATNSITLAAGYSYTTSGGSMTAEIVMPPLPDTISYSQPTDPTARTLNTSYEVGATSGTFDVSADGSANYNIPLYVAPGTNSMQPSLGINYNSNGGIGILGKGWSLSGTSAIYRTASSFYYDGSVDPVDFDSNDAFVLDGQRLIKDGSIYRSEVATYATITPTYTGSILTGFEVKTKDGKTIEYGSGEAKLKNQDNNQYFEWYITSVTDAYGNYMNYIYDNDTYSGIRLKEIQYTGNTSAGLTPYNSIKFSYNARPESRNGYVYGQKVINNQLLKKVICEVDGDVAHTYDFNFTSSNATPLLSEIIETGSQGKRYNSTVFSYHDYQSSGQDVNTNLSDNFSDKKYGDINGDGRTDLIVKYGSYIKYYKTNSTASGLTYVGQISAGSSDYEVGDFNGDGLDDIVVYSSTAVTYYKATGSGFTHVSSSDISLSGIQKVYAHDVNGDFNDDVVIQTSSSLYVYKGDVSAPFSTSFHGAMNWGTDAYFYDFTGDGKEELCINDGSYPRFYQFSNTGFTLFYTGNSAGSTFVFGDFNGDGKMDFIKGNVIGGNFWGTAFIADGKSFIEKAFMTGTELGQESIISYDSNGDGKYEIYAYTIDNLPYDPGTYQADQYLYNGDSFEFVDHTMVNLNDKEMDFNGDGIKDGIYTFSGDGDIYFQYFHKGNTKNRLYKIADGLNNKTIIDYENIVDNNVYTSNSSQASNPYANFNGPLYVVSQVQQSNGRGGYFQTNYSYTGGIRFKPQDSFMGFKQVDAVSNETQFTNRTAYDFHATYPFVSKVTKTVIDNHSNNVNKTEMDYTITSIASKRVQRYLSQKNFWNYLDNANTSSSTTYSVNSYGNMTHQQTTYSGGAGSSDTYYENYATVAGSPVPNVPQTVRIVNVRNSKPSFERKVTINYNSTTGFLISKVIDSDESYPMILSYDPVANGLGLVWKSRVGGSGIATRETVYQWDGKGRFITQTTSPEGQITKTLKDPVFGKTLSVTSPAGYTDESSYDGFGRLDYNQSSDQFIIREWYSGSLANCVYDVHSTGQSHPEKTVYYDRLGRDLQTKTQAFEAGKNIMVNKTYNDKGQTASISKPYFYGESAYSTVFTYDDWGRIKEENLCLFRTKFVYNF